MRATSLACAAAAALSLSACAEMRTEPVADASLDRAVSAAEAAASGGAATDIADGADAKARARLLRPAIERHARENAVPVALANAVIRIESNFNAHVVHAGNYGLMQIRLATARSLGFAGSPAALLDPDTNLRFGLKYLAGAYRQSGGDLCLAVMKYQSGYLTSHPNGANRAYCQRVKRLISS
jgi:soluble lytic murein transglycosylase-like protein